MKANRRESGFSLIEVAVALFIITLMLGSILVPLGARVENRTRTETEIQLKEIREALLGFAIVNGRLPRPAQSELIGTEKASCATETQCTGFLPWETLGVGSKDSWGKRFLYSVTPAFATGTVSYGTLTVARTAGTKSVQDRGTASPFSLYYTAGGPTASATIAAVVLSHGKNNWGTLQDGVAVGDGSSTNIDEDANAAASVNFIARPISTNIEATGGEFDDLLIHIPDLTVFGTLVKAGKL